MNASCVPDGVVGCVVVERAGGGRRRRARARKAAPTWASEGVRGRAERQAAEARRRAETARREAEAARKRRAEAARIGDVFEFRMRIKDKVRDLRVDGHAGRAARTVLLAVSRVTGVGVDALRLADECRGADQQVARVLAAHALWSMAKLPVKEIAVVLMVGRCTARSLLRRAERLLDDDDASPVPMAGRERESLAFAAGCVAEEAVRIGDELDAADNPKAARLAAQRARIEARNADERQLDALVDRVVRAVSDLTGVSAERIASGDRCRLSEVSASRAVVAAVARDRHGLSLPAIAARLGLRSHATVYDAIARLKGGEVRVPIGRGGTLDGRGAARHVMRSLDAMDGEEG